MKVIPQNPSETLIEKCVGTIERVVFHNEENGFVVLRAHIRGRRDLTTIVGCLACAHAGEEIECHGQWIQDKTHGLQFRATEIKTVTPHTKAGIEKYLASGLIKGIGPHFAKQLIHAFGTQVFEIIEREPARLNSLPGIGRVRSTQIIESWQQQKSVRDIMVFLHRYHIGTARAVRIFKMYGNEAIKKIESNPYCLALDIHGIGFKTADQLAQQMGIPSDSVIRAQAGVRHLLQEQATHGHCVIFWEELVRLSEALLEISRDTIEAGIREEIRTMRIQQEPTTEGVYLSLMSLYRAEMGIVEHLYRLQKTSCRWSTIAIDKAMTWVEAKTKIQLSESQKQAVQQALQEKVLIITGGPGVGKTTVINSILQILKQKGITMLLCAPTGRAAKRLSESTQMPAKTIHRLLGKRGMSGAPTNVVPATMLDVDLLVVDEASMIDVQLFHALLRALTPTAALLIVGDVDQLPSVGPGCVLSDLMESQKIPTVHLTEIFRQAATSQIIVNAHRINQGHMPWLKAMPGESTDFYWISAETPEEIQEKLLHVVTQRIPSRFKLNAVHDIQVLTPMNRGQLGVQMLNTCLQKMLNTKQTPEVARFGLTFKEGDKIIQTVNNYDKDVFNGDIGIIRAIDMETKQLRIEFEQRLVTYDDNELDEITLAYAISIHKSQGSEYPAVVIPLTTQHFMLLERNLLYTAVTRGKKLVVLIGQKKALGLAISTVRAQKRMTRLTHRLKATDG